jgi:hypothetical protein
MVRTLSLQISCAGLIRRPLMSPGVPTISGQEFGVESLERTRGELPPRGARLSRRRSTGV